MSIISKIKEAFSGNDKKDNGKSIEANKPMQPVKPRRKKTDSHLYTQVITYDPTGIMILISYTEEYFYSMIEFLGYATGCIMSSVALKSSYDEDSGKVDKYGEPIMVSHDRYYVLFSAIEEDLPSLYEQSRNLSNEILEAVTQDFYDRCSPDTFEDIIDDGILERDKFETFFPRDTTKDDYGRYTIDNITITYMNGYQILSKLPDVFNARDILDVILLSVDDNDTYENICSTTLYEILKDYKNDVIQDIAAYRPAFEALLNRAVTLSDYEELVKPRYLYDDELYEDDNGKMSDEELDDIFKEKYEKFSAVSDDGIHYEDIDEEIGEDEETENMREVDILSDNSSSDVEDY